MVLGLQLNKQERLNTSITNSSRASTGRLDYDIGTIEKRTVNSLNNREM